ncbi:MAG: hypothetical protein IJY85_11215 [Ruminococcus sp.]|nr:hypothetical protein [Ruminococcus sp.]
MNLRHELQAWDDAVGEKVSALALSAEKGFSESEEQLVRLVEQIADAAKHRPCATAHPVPERLNPPQMQGGESA